MPKWTEYTSKDTLADNDEVMFYDATAKANKRGLMSKIWDYMVNKMATAVISKLGTDNKTIIGAINALNDNKANYGSYDGDLNDIPVKPNKQTIYRTSSSCKNNPAPGEYGIVRTMYVDGSEYAIQEFLSLSNAKLFVRTKGGNVWGIWVEK